MELALSLFKQKRASRRRYALIPPGFPCPLWAVSKTGVKSDWFNGFVAIYRNDEGRVFCWPIGIGEWFWEINAMKDEDAVLIGKPTVFKCRFWVFQR